MRGEESRKKKVAECVEKNDFSELKDVVVLKAPKDSGKTTILKMVIELLYDRFPGSWRGRDGTRRQSFDRERVVNYSLANLLSAEYSGVFSINGVIVVVATAGDFTKYVVGNFSLFAKARAVIGVTAIQQGNIAEVVYEEIKAKLDFEEVVVSLSKRYVGSECTGEERKVAVKIVSTIVDILKCYSGVTPRCREGE